MFPANCFGAEFTLKNFTMRRMVSESSRAKGLRLKLYVKSLNAGPV